MTRPAPRPGRSPALLVAIAALAVALVGTTAATYAAARVDGDTLIARGSLSGNRLERGSVTGHQIAEQSLRKVPSAESADTVSPGTVQTFVALGAGWQSAGGRKVGYRKDGAGYVHLEGAVGRVGSLTPGILTLPAGFRPSGLVYVPVATTDSSGHYVPGMLAITPSGEVQLAEGEDDRVSLEGFSYHADQ